MGPLDDIKILDLTRVISGPMCTQVFSDFGATVWKIESREGDETRAYNSAGAAMLNRGKRSLVVDLADARGQKLTKALVAKADVAVENFRPGGLKRFGLDFKDLVEEFPGLVAASLSGFGQNGPLRDALGYDAAIQAATGQMTVSGEPGAPPTRIGVYINDIMLGINAATAVLIALHDRSRTGLGQHLDLSLYDAGLFSLLATADGFLNGDAVPERHGSKHPFKVPVQPFDAADGPFMLCVGNDGQFKRMCDAMGLDALGTDPRFQENRGRRDHREELEERLQVAFVEKPVQHWLDLFIPAKVPAAPLNSIPAAVSDPQAIARNMIWEVETDAGPGRVIGSPLQHFSRTPPQVQRPPALAENTADVLSEVLHLPADDIAVLARDGVIVIPADGADDRNETKPMQTQMGVQQ